MWHMINFGHKCIFHSSSIPEFKECFSLYDRDGDGQISIDQLKLVMRSLEQCPTQTDINEIARKSGEISKVFDTVENIPTCRG